MYQMLPHHALSRTAVANAGKLIQEFDDIILHPLDTQMISEFSIAYKAFLHCMEDRFVSEELVQSAYKKLNATMSRVLSHYVDVSMLCRRFYSALLDFSKDEQDYNRLLPQMHKHLSMDEYTRMVTLYADLKTHFQECCLPDSSLTEEFRDKLKTFAEKLATNSETVNMEDIVDNEQVG